MDLESALKSTILEALIEKITNVQNKSINFTAMNAFTNIIIGEPELALLAIQLITFKMQSPNEWEALQALDLLESCVDCKCESFLAEVGKFRFLNELIKLVSPKYMGNTTSTTIKNKIIGLLKAWSRQYYKETKIKEVYDMLIKQSVAKMNNKCESQSSLWWNSNAGTSIQSSVSEVNDDKSRMLQKLLRSNKPNDLKEANLLIKTIVKEKEEKEDLRLIANSVKLLSEMLSNLSADNSESETEIIRELKETCVNMKPTLAFMISSYSRTTKESAELFELNDFLNDTLQLYQMMIDERKLKRALFVPKANSCNPLAPCPTLLDLSSSVDDAPLILPTAKCEVAEDAPQEDSSCTTKVESSMDTLKELFDSSFLLTSHDKNNIEENSGPKPSTSRDLFQDLNVLGRSFLSPMEPGVSINDVTKVTLNDLVAKSSTFEHTCINELDDKDVPLLDDDDALVNGNEVNEFVAEACESNNIKTISDETQKKCIEPLSNISVSLMDVKIDYKEKKVTAFEDPNGITVNIQLTGNKPRDDVSVFLVSANSRKTEYISNFVFQPVVSKDCRLKLQPASKTELPPYNPHIPVETIVQIMLIASIHKECIPLKFVLSYVVKDETITEMGEVPIYL